MKKIKFIVWKARKHEESTKEAEVNIRQMFAGGDAGNRRSRAVEFYEKPAPSRARAEGRQPSPGCTTAQAADLAELPAGPRTVLQCSRASPRLTLDIGGLPFTSLVVLPQNNDKNTK